nr:hypothetical protein [Tanacetum cinerariifolium]
MNQNNEDCQLFVFEIDANDDETDVVFLEQAYAYHQQLVAEENRLPLTRNLINRDRKGAEERLMPIISMIIAGANNDINVLDNSSLFDDLLNDTTPVLLM